jgi:predicted SprT family Zn-dependent metalloprotease
MLPAPELVQLFEEINSRHFDGFLDPPKLKWNRRLRSSAGRFVPGARPWSIWAAERPPTIEIASYLLQEANALDLIRDTLAHEMIHYWLWVRRKPYGHTPEFWDKMTVMGVSRYNPVPRVRPYRYLYRCKGCRGEFPARRKLGLLACARCCKEHAGGRFDPRFELLLERKLSPGELVKSPG